MCELWMLKTFLFHANQKHCNDDCDVYHCGVKIYIILSIFMIASCYKLFDWTCMWMSFFLFSLYRSISYSILTKYRLCNYISHISRKYLYQLVTFFFLVLCDMPWVEVMSMNNTNNISIISSRNEFRSNEIPGIISITFILYLSIIYKLQRI